MKNTLGHGALALALVTGCAVTAEHSDVSNDSPVAPADQGGSQETPGSGDTPVGSSCLRATPSGLIELSRTWSGDLGRPGELAAAVDGGYFFSDGVTVARHGADGIVRWSKAFGGLVASDRAGNVYVAGLFDRPTDFGNGTVEPHAYDGHAFLAKLDEDGNLVSLFDELGLCGVTSVSALAVHRSGRIAISGDGLGTIVLDAEGSIVETSSIVASGLAFDLYGNLVAVGAAGGDGFIVKLDDTGREMFRLAVGDIGADNTPQSVNKVAIDDGGNIAVLGWLDSEALVFGREIRAGSTPESGDLDAAFVVKLTSDGVPLWSTVHPGQEIGGLTVDPLGNVVVSTSALGNRYPFTIPQLEKLSADGASLWVHSGDLGDGPGRALGVTSDACGRTWWAVTAMTNGPSPATSIPLSFHTRLAL